MAPGRIVAGHIHWGVRDGLVVISSYFHDSVDLDDANCQLQAELQEAVRAMAQVEGGFNRAAPEDRATSLSRIFDSEVKVALNAWAIEAGEGSARGAKAARCGSRRTWR